MEQVLPHSELEKLSEDLWILEGSLPHDNPLPRNMVIFRLPDKRLWVHSPVAVNNKTKNEIESLGRPAWIVVPNEMHRLDAKTWKDAFPDAKVVCPKAARRKVQKKVKVDKSCEDVFKAGPIIAHPMAGVVRSELAYELNLPEGKALVVNDLLVNVEKLPGVFGMIIKLMGRLGKFKVPFPQEVFFLYQKRLFKSWLQTMAKKNFTIVTVSHGRPVTSDVGEWLRSAAHNLLH